MVILFYYYVNLEIFLMYIEKIESNLSTITKYFYLRQYDLPDNYVTLTESCFYGNPCNAKFGHSASKHEEVFETFVAWKTTVEVLRDVSNWKRNVPLWRPT